MKHTRNVQCSFCLLVVRRKTLLRHFLEYCPMAPKLSDGEFICAICQKVKPVGEFPRSAGKPRGHDGRCKLCNSENTRLHTEELKAGKRTLRLEPHLRPGRWILKPCEFCSEHFNAREMKKHLPFCEKNLNARPGATIVRRDAMENMLQAQKDHLAIPEARAQKSRNLKYAYGISLADYDRMLAAQDGKCAICKRPPTGNNRAEKSLHVDHDHVTGATRALLCTRCNHLIGNCLESAAILIEAMQYLLRYKRVDMVS